MSQFTEPTLGPVIQESRPTGIDDRTIGRILVDMGKLRPTDAPRVFKLAREKGLRFGEAARKLRLVSEADVQYALSVQFNFPYLNGARGSLSPELSAAYEPFDAQAEALRSLRTQLVLHWLTPKRRTVAIVSPHARDGRSYLAANLAVMFAQLGEKTLLVDADLRAPRQHRIFGLANRRGLAHVLNGGFGIECAEPVQYFDNLSVLAAGTAPPNPLELLSRQELAALLAEAARRYRVVILDTAAAERGADSMVVAARAGGALLLARENHTRGPELQRLHAAVSSCSTRVVGTVLNRV